MSKQTTTIAKLNIAANSPEFKSIRERIKTAIATLNPVEVVTPLNLKTAKSNWIKEAKNGVFTNPHFEYNLELLEETISHRDRLEELELELNTLRPDLLDTAASFVWDQLHFALLDGIGTTYLAEAIKNGNDNDAAEAVAKKYGLPEQMNVARALETALQNCAEDTLDHEIVNLRIPLSEDARNLLLDRELNAEQIGEMFNWAMNQYFADPWPIEILENCGSIDVRDKSSFGHPIIAIPDTRKVTAMKLAELIGHEIESHWRGSINAEKIGALKCDDELVYEGIAVLKDKCFNRKYNATFSLSSCYYILAMQEALHSHSFSETAKLIYGYLPDSTKNREAKTWTYTYRVYRGITDTKNPHGYAFTKDRAYFEGWFFARDLDTKGLRDYLSFSTLNQESFKRFMEIVDLEDVKKNAILDLNIQERSLDKMLKNLLYAGTQAANLVKIAETIV